MLIRISAVKGHLGPKCASLSLGKQRRESDCRFPAFSLCVRSTTCPRLSQARALQSAPVLRKRTHPDYPQKSSCRRVTTVDPWVVRLKYDS